MRQEFLVARQFGGGKSGATARRKLPSAIMAEGVFRAAKSRLLNVNNWYIYAGEKGAKFQITDNNGLPLETDRVREGNLIRIKLGNADQFDWVIVEKIQSEYRKDFNEELVGFRVRPTSDPLSDVDTTHHFYKNDATSSFMVIRSGKNVCAIEKGRNEKINPEGKFFRKLRNLIIAIGGIFGASASQWKLWAESMLEPVKKA